MSVSRDFLNISCYLFVELQDLAHLRSHIYTSAIALQLKGTVLLAEEGINIFLAGAPEPVRQFVADLQKDPRLQALQPKESYSHTLPFRKLIVKIKNEIIRMNHPTIRPQDQRAPSVQPATLLRWLTQGVDDEGNEVVVLDTRNAFEVDEGKFVNALDWRINKFSEFPEAVQKNRQQLKGKTIVSYCTGGIRCEKAAIYMADSGIERVYQLDGGILKYFEEAGGAHYQGRCFVFDERLAIDPSLASAMA
jgi:UPF0176 protein